MVIESLSPRGLHSGRHVYEDLETFNAASGNRLLIQYVEAPTLQLFWASIDRICNDVKSQGYYPILHLDCHGSSDTKGIILADGSFVSWNDLKPKLTKINLLTQCKFLVVLALCYGGYLSQICYPTDRAPFWGLIGPTDVVPSIALEQGLSAFYRELFQTLDGDTALAALRKVNPSIKYAFVPAEFFFKYVSANYLIKYCNPQALDDRAANILLKIGASIKKRNVKRLIKRMNPRSFDKYAHKFFMVDLFPDNASRFVVLSKDIYALADRLQEGDIFHLRESL